MNYFSQLKLIIIEFGVMIGLICGLLTFSVYGETGRILNIKSDIITKEGIVRLRDIVENHNILSDVEKKMKITSTPLKNDKNLKLIEVAYKLQSLSSLLDVKLRGKSNITVRKLTDTKYIEKTKEQLISYLKKTAPWDTWEMDVLLTSSDTMLISRIGPFDTMKALTRDNKSLLGHVTFKLTFFDDYNRPVGNATITPILLRKMQVVVMNNNLDKGSIINSSDVKKIPLWVGDKKTNYTTNIKSCVGREVSKRMLPGDLLKSSDLMNPMCVKRGETLWIECKLGNMVVNAAVLALENGRKNDFIKVRNQSSNKIFTVRLVGDKKGIHKIGS